MNRKSRLAATPRKSLVVLMSGLLLLLPAAAMGMLRATGQVNVEGNIKIYTYRFINDVEPTYRITSLFIGMDEAGLRSISTLSLPSPSYELNCGAEELTLLESIYEQEYLEFRLTTPADVPTDYAREDKVGLGAWNWYYIVDANGHGDWGWGDNPLPVPARMVPEPSSLASLGLAVSGAFAALIRRRRS